MQRLILQEEDSSLGQTNTAILAVGGYTTTAVDNVESWNGSSWTEIAEILTTGYSASGSGTSTEGLIMNLTQVEVINIGMVHLGLNKQTLIQNTHPVVEDHNKEVIPLL